MKKGLIIACLLVLILGAFGYLSLTTNNQDILPLNNTSIDANKSTPDGHSIDKNQINKEDSQRSTNRKSTSQNTSQSTSQNTSQISEDSKQETNSYKKTSDEVTYYYDEKGNVYVDYKPKTNT